MNCPRVSILLPAYNAERYLREAIDSMLSQTYQNFELLIIDDGSKDRTAEIVRSYTDERIRFIQNECNIGLANTLNKGMRLARGEYLARMDADDISLPTRLQTQVEYLDSHPDVILCSVALRLFGATDRDAILPDDFERIKINLLFSSAIGHASSMWRNQVFLDNNLYFLQDEFPAEDYGLWTRAVFVGKMVNMPDILYMYRIYPEQVTNNQARSIEHCNIVRERYIKRIVPKLDRGTIQNFTHNHKIINIFKYIKLIFALSSSKKFNNRMLFKTMIKYLFNNYILNYKAKLRRLINRLINRLKNVVWMIRLRYNLHNRSFTIISNDCWAGKVYEDANMQYLTPTIGLFFLPEDYLRFCNNLKHYIEADLEIIDISEDGYPIGKIDDVTIYFQHYKSADDCIEKWNRRKQRINWDNLYLKFSDRNYATQEQLEQFDKLPQSKVIFTAKSYGLINEIVISDYTEKSYVGDLYSNPWPWRNKFDITKWLNTK